MFGIKRRFLLLSTNLARERLQIDRLAAHHNKHRWRDFRGTNTDDLERPWIQK